MSNVKYFKGGKSKAVKGLARFSDLLVPRAELLLVQDPDTKDWGFDTEHAAEMLEKMTTPEAEADSEQAAQEAKELDLQQNPDAYTKEGELKDGSESEEDTYEGPAPAPGMFAAIGSTLGNGTTNPAPAATRAPAASRTNYTIEKDRPEQNGIKRPSAGGLCRAVWDAMDAQREANEGTVPSTQQVRDLALMHNWNINNAMIEYYQWRKFNGITGRAKKVEAATVA